MVEGSFGPPDDCSFDYVVGYVAAKNVGEWSALMHGVADSDSGPDRPSASEIPCEDVMLFGRAFRKLARHVLINIDHVQAGNGRLRADLFDCAAGRADRLASRHAEHQSRGSDNRA